MNRKTQNRLLNGSLWAIPCMLIGSYCFNIGLNAYRISQYRQLGEGYSVRETASERIFTLGNGRGGRDYNKNGTLDQVFVTMALSPMMGGPGFASWPIKTTEDDLKRFERAHYLLNKNKQK